MSEVSAQLLHGFPGFLGEHEAGHEYASRSGAQPQKDGSRGGHQHQGRSCCAPVCFSRADRSCPLVVQGCYVVAGLGPAFLSDPSFESASNQNGGAERHCEGGDGPTKRAQQAVPPVQFGGG
jgi:hypothetical protein